MSTVGLSEPGQPHMKPSSVHQKNKSIGYEDIVCEEELSNVLSLSVQQRGSGSANHCYSLIHNIS